MFVSLRGNPGRIPIFQLFAANLAGSPKSALPAFAIEKSGSVPDFYKQDDREGAESTWNGRSMKKISRAGG
jgi:hypothetical protein